VHNDHYQDENSVDFYASSDALPFNDNYFDLIFSQGAIDYMPGPKASLIEMFRVLKPGGILLIYTYDRATLESIHVNVLQSRRDWELTHHVFSEKELLMILRDCGFKSRDVSLELFSHPSRHIITLPITKTTLQYQTPSELSGIWRAFSCYKPKPFSLLKCIRTMQSFLFQIYILKAKS
jgi:SAM-dependent methyltransferase